MTFNGASAIEGAGIAPKLIHPTPLVRHGLFGVSYVRQHMMIDTEWTPNSLCEEFSGMTQLFEKNVEFGKHAISTEMRKFRQMRDKLKIQCQDGRQKLQNCLHNDNRKTIRNYLIRHKDMQRLYQRMPLYEAEDNLNQRTFIMRKERDRLTYRLNKLKTQLYDKLIERANIENRVKYDDNFSVDIEKKIANFLKELANSRNRLEAYATINHTYKKMIQILRYDSIFYEPILSSLNNDIRDQQCFINYVIYLGKPAMWAYKKLQRVYWDLNDRTRKIKRASELLNELDIPHGFKEKPKKKEDNEPPRGRYVRETRSMNLLKAELIKIEAIIKRVKFATLVSTATEIYPIFKSMMQNNLMLHKKITNDIMGHIALEEKMKYSKVLQNVLLNNLSEEDINRRNRIKELKNLIIESDKEEKEIIDSIRNKADIYLQFRTSLWNLLYILRHVYVRRTPRTNDSYRTSYLHLPLLNFDMMRAKAVPPMPYEANIKKMLSLVHEKLRMVVINYNRSEPTENLEKYPSIYGREFLDANEVGSLRDSDVKSHDHSEYETLVEARHHQNVPTRKRIKALSMKLVETAAKRDE